MIPALRMVLAILFLIIVIPVAALFAFPWTLLTRKIGFLYWNGMTILRVGLWIVGVRFETQGLDKIDSAGTYVFMSNHASNLDPAVLMPLIPRRTSVLVKKEMWRFPIIGSAFDIASLVPVDRSNRNAAIESMRRAGEVMRQGINMMVYPEGTRSLDGRLLPFKKGSFHLSSETGFPIVPVTMLGTFELLPKGKFAARGGMATVVFHPPVDPRKYSSIEDLIAATSDAIRSALPPERQ